MTQSESENQSMCTAKNVNDDSAENEMAKWQLALFIVAVGAICSSSAFSQSTGYKPTSDCVYIGTCNDASSPAPSAPKASTRTSPSRVTASPEDLSPTPTTEPFQPLDPTQDYDGKPCSYFTKPAKRQDGSGSNFYSKGVVVQYGGNVYRCTDGVWRDVLPGAVENPPSAIELETSHYPSY